MGAMKKGGLLPGTVKRIPTADQMYTWSLSQNYGVACLDPKGTASQVQIMQMEYSPV